MGVIVFVDADGHCRGFGGDLNHGIGDLSVEGSMLAGGDDVKSIADFVKA